MQKIISNPAQAIFVAVVIIVLFSVLFTLPVNQW